MYLGHLHLTEHYSAVAPARSMAMGGGLRPSQPGAVVCVADTDRGQAGLIDALNSFTMTVANGHTWTHVQSYYLPSASSWVRDLTS